MTRPSRARGRASSGSWPPAACGRPPPCRSGRCGEVGMPWRRGSDASAGSAGGCSPRTRRPTRISSVLAEAAGGRPMLLAGSAGLATALAGHETPAAPGVRRVLPRRPLVVVAGSAHPATRAQLSRLSRRAGLDVLTPPRDRRGRRSRAAPRDGRAPGRRGASAHRARAARCDPPDRRRDGDRGAPGAGSQRAPAHGRDRAGPRAREPSRAGRSTAWSAMTKAGGFGDADALERAWEACA